MMSYITTVTGKQVDPVRPTPEMIDITDIAHALSLICRANGHTRFFYSVAQHSIACHHEARRRGLSPRIQLGCLLHDGSEAYMSDVTRPVKALLSEYLKIEDRLQTMIWTCFLGEPLTDAEKRAVFKIDNEMLSYEFRHLMPEPLSDEYKLILSDPPMAFVHPAEIELEFIRLATGQ